MRAPWAGAGSRRSAGRRPAPAAARRPPARVPRRTGRGPGLPGHPTVHTGITAVPRGFSLSA
ncbi:hypothetical protein GCM10019016_038590 [Streptomyces prasinosporus]|uniref:Uncharacterized protein n=1 Tax=Streptomyces prasinosporus TaxID=68256 RepID=A0ABP6TNA5_9ACTN